MIQFASEGFRYGDTNPDHVKAVEYCNNVLELDSWTLFKLDEQRDLTSVFRFRCIDTDARIRNHIVDCIAKKVYNQGNFPSNLETWLFIEADGEAHWSDAQKIRDEKFKRRLYHAVMYEYELSDARLVRIDKYDIIKYYEEGPEILLEKLLDKKFCI